MVLSKNSTPGMNPQVGGISQIQSISLSSKVLEPQIIHPNPWDLHQRDEAPKCLALKTSMAYTQETQRTIGN